MIIPSILYKDKRRVKKSIEGMIMIKLKNTVETIV